MKNVLNMESIVHLLSKKFTLNLKVLMFHINIDFKKTFYSFNVTLIAVMDTKLQIKFNDATQMIY